MAFELRHLKYFVMVAEEKNFTRAAERLFIAQPPLSRQIKQLEDDLGAELFERGSRPLALTETGKFFYAHAQQLLSQAAEIKAMTKRVSQIHRTLSIGYVASTLYGKLPKIIRLYRYEYNSVDLQLHEMTTVEQIKALKEGVIDVGFGRIKHEDQNVHRIVLRDERLIVALPIGHPMAEDSERLPLKSLVQDNLIVFPKAPRPSFADQVLSAFHDRALTPKKVIEVRELQIAIGLVAAGEGIAIVPNSLIGMKRDDVIYKDLNERHAYSPIIMSVRAMDQSEEIRNLLDLIYRIYDEEQIPYVRATL